VITEDLINSSYEACSHIAKAHYENFPLALWCFPRQIRRSIAAIYAFARMSDDIVDEGNLTADERLTLLNDVKHQLQNAINGDPPENQFVFIALADTLKKQQLDPQSFFDLLDAFEQDITKKTYANKQEQLDYCKRSANPVGKIVLQLFHSATPETINYSNNICTALQLINFLQDIVSDFTLRHRVYIPLDLLAKYHIPTEEILDKKHAVALQAIMNSELDDIQQLLDQGRPLLQQLKGRLKWYIAIVITCADYLTMALRKRGGNIHERPVLKPTLQYFYHFLRLLFIRNSKL